MTRQPVFFGIALAIMVTTGGLLLSLPKAVKEVPLALRLEDLPVLLGGWVASNDVPTDVLPVDRKVPEHFLRTYERGSQRVWVSLDYYPSQEDGHRPLARALVSLGPGGSTLSEGKLEIPLDGRHAISANLIVMRTGSRQVGTLYWYQLRGRSIASDHWYRALLIYSRLLQSRTDGVRIRIAFPIPEKTPLAEAVKTQFEFVKVFYPEIVRRLPR